MKTAEEWNENLVNTKKEALKRLEEIKQEEAELQAIINKPDRWQDGLAQPCKDSYYYIDGSIDCGLRVINVWFGSPNRKPEHAFRTAEQAELMLEKTLLMWEMHQFAHVRNEGWEADWEDEDEQRKYGAIYAVNSLRVEWDVRNNFFIFGIAVKSEEIAQEMFEEFGERIEAIYNKQY